MKLLLENGRTIDHAVDDYDLRGYHVLQVTLDHDDLLALFQSRNLPYIMSRLLDRTKPHG